MPPLLQVSGAEVESYYLINIPDYLPHQTFYAKKNELAMYTINKFYHEKYLDMESKTMLKLYEAL